MQSRTLACPTVALAALALLVSGCSKKYQREVFETPCGNGRLILTLHVTTHPPAPNETKLWLEYESGGARRTVDILKPRLKLYAPPTEAEKFSRLRDGPDNWPVFVSPRGFTPAEYSLIRARLAAELPAIDAATAVERPGESLDYGQVVKLSSIRYVEPASFRKSYRGTFRGVTIEVHPDGSIWCNHPQGATLVGSIVDRGRKAIVSEGYGLLEKAGIPNSVDYVLSCKDAQGRTLASDFTVEQVTNQAYDLAMKRERADREKW